VACSTLDDYSRFKNLQDSDGTDLVFMAAVVVSYVLLSFGELKGRGFLAFCALVVHSVPILGMLKSSCSPCVLFCKRDTCAG